MIYYVCNSFPECRMWCGMGNVLQIIFNAVEKLCLFYEIIRPIVSTFVGMVCLY